MSGGAITMIVVLPSDHREACFAGERPPGMSKTIKVMDHGPHGYVAYDRARGIFEVAFHTTLMRLDEERLAYMAASMEERITIHSGHACPLAKLFFFDNGDRSMYLALCL